MFIKILLNYILGYVRITVEGYYIERFINICRNNKIIIWNLKRDKSVQLNLNIGIIDFKEIKKIIFWVFITYISIDWNIIKFYLEYRNKNRKCRTIRQYI